MARWLAFAQSRSEQARLGGIVEADQTYVLESRKGSRLWSKPAGAAAAPARKPRKRGGKASKRGLSDEQVAVLIAADRSLGACARLLGLSHQPINHTRGERVRGELHIQIVNSRAERLKDMLRHHRGVATRYLGNYLNWFHLVTLNPNPSSRTCLSAAIGQKHAEKAYA